MKASVALLPGDAGGSEVAAQAARVLKAIADHFGHEIQIETGIYGALAIDSCGDPLPAKTLKLALRADALLLGGGASGAPPARAIRRDRETSPNCARFSRRAAASNPQATR